MNSSTSCPNPNLLGTSEEAPLKLQTLLGSTSVDAFYSEYWEKKPLHITEQDPARFNSLFSLDRLDHLLSYLPQETRIGLIKNDIDKPDQPGAKSTAGTNICDLFDNFADGKTMIVNAMHKYWPPVRELCTRLSIEMGLKTQVNMYVTPKHSTGFSPHWDDHEVFVFQISGEKFWRLYGNGPSLPRRSQHDPIAALRQRTLNPGAPVQELTMRPGDLLYIPRGCVHNASATDTTSVHLTLGINAVSWEELLISCIKDLSKKNPEFREAIPPGILMSGIDNAQTIGEQCKVLFQLASEKLDAKAGLDSLSQSLVRAMEAHPSGHFVAMDSVDSINLDTRVTRRPPGVVRLIEEDDYVALIWPGFFQQAPEKMILAFHYIVQNSSFRIGDIPGWYTDEERLKTVSHLITKGLLQIES